MGMYLDKTGLSHLKSKITTMIAARVINWSEIQGKPSTFAPSSHMHDVATTAANGFMSSGDKSKLNGIAAGANKYTHPSSHPASMIQVTVGSSNVALSDVLACAVFPISQTDEYVEFGDITEWVNAGKPKL